MISKKYNINELIDIWEESVRATHDFVSMGDILYYKELMPSYIKDSTIYTYMDCEICAGFIGFTKNHLDMLFISPKYFGRGIGSSLLEYAVNKHGINTTEVNEQNTAALKFYKKHGFKIVSKTETDEEGKNYPLLTLDLF